MHFDAVGQNVYIIMITTRKSCSLPFYIVIDSKQYVYEYEYNFVCNISIDSIRTCAM